MNVTLPNGVVIQGVPEGATKQQIMQKAIAAGLATEADFGVATAQQPISDVAGPELDRQLSEYYASQPRQQKPQRSLGEKILGFGDAGLSVLSGMTTGALAGGLGSVAGIGQSIKQGTYGTSAGADQAQSVAEMSAEGATWSPRTEAGREYLQSLGKTLEPLQSLPPVGIGQASRIGMLPQAQRLPKKAPDLEIDESLIFEDPAEASRVALNRAVPPTKRIDPKNPERLINDDLAKSAIRQGFNENFIQTLKQLPDADKKQVLKMATTIDRGESDFLMSRYNRPSDVVGQSLADRISYIKSVNKKAGKDVDLAVKSLPETVDPAVPFESTLNSLVEMGVKFDNDDTPIFRGSEIQGFGPDEKIVRQVVERMKEVNTAKDLHNLKKYIYNNVYYGKRAEGGIQPKTERVLKEFASGINEVLGEASPDYRTANTIYSETINSLDGIQSAAGKSIDIFGESADQALGTGLRSLLSNNKTRLELENQVNTIDEVAKKYGGNFQDDIKAQVAIVNELEKIYGTQGQTSLGGELGKQAQEIINKGVRGALTDKAFSILSKSEKQRRQDSLKALKKLLMRKEQ